ncbi:MAG: tetratricopeptide repeat protein, partial [Bacteroidetes bacterium]|nr:tetratricopeptide repeat protein [Bacteroidota bacterium]
GGGNAFIFHLNNILLHIANSILVYILIRKISPKNAVVALITAAFFAVHPMHVESVAWVSERKDVLYSFFFLLSLIIYCNYLKLQKTKLLIFSAMFFVLSCLSKSAAVVLPLVMLLLDYYNNRKFSKKSIIEKIPFFVISLIFGFIALHSQEGAVENMAPGMSFVQHISIVFYSFMIYIFKAFIPVHLSAIYPYPIELENAGTLPKIYYLSILCVGLLLYFVWYSRKWGKNIIFGFLFFVITIILVLQFVLVGAMSMADRYTYIPYIGIFFIIGKLFEKLSEKGKLNYKKYFITILAFVFMAFSAITYGRVKIWENDDTLFSDVIKKYPDGGSTQYLNRGAFYMYYYAAKVYKDDSVKREIYKKKAISDFQNSLKFKITVNDMVLVYSIIGKDKGDKGDFAGAINYLNEAIKFDNNYLTAYNDRACAKCMLKDYEGALKDYNKVIELNQKDALAYFNRGTTKDQLHDYTGAINDFDNAIKIDKKYVNAYFNRGTAKFKLKDYDGAYEDYNKVIALNPKDSDAIRNRDIVKPLLKNVKK